MNVFGDAFAVLKPRYNDLGMDRMNYYYSPVIISAIAVTLTAKQYVGEPLQCWVPAQFTKAWEQYAENYCFVYNTYWVRPDEEIQSEIGERISAQLHYYQWVPFIMMFEAGLFHFPALVWSKLSRTSGLNVEGLVKSAVKADEENDEEKLAQTVSNMCSILEDSNQIRIFTYVDGFRKARNVGAGRLENYRRFGKLNGTYLSNVYLVAKILYCTNSFFQFIFMNFFLRQPDHLWGVSILKDIVTGTNWEDSGNFPRIAMCDFEVRSIGNVQRYSIQCVLVLNMFNEKIFLFLYWWIIAVGLFTFLDAAWLLMDTKMHGRRASFVKKFVRCSPEERVVLGDFTRDYLTPDLFLIIQFINGHSSEIVTCKVMQLLYDNYRSSDEVCCNHPYLQSMLRQPSIRMDNEQKERPPSEELHRPFDDDLLSSEVHHALFPHSPGLSASSRVRQSYQHPTPYETSIKFKPISLLSPNISSHGDHSYGR